MTSTPNFLKRGPLERRAIIPCIIISCIIIYAFVFISYLGNIEPIKIEKDIKIKKDTKICNILIAHGGDHGAGFATLIYAYPINFILYALKYNYTLWLDYNPSYNDLYYDKDYGPNAFEYYFNGIEPNWNLCDKGNIALQNVEHRNNSVLNQIFSDLELKEKNYDDEDDEDSDSDDSEGFIYIYL